jgi:hypothetical protein
MHYYNEMLNQSRWFSSEQKTQSAFLESLKGRIQQADDDVFKLAEIEPDNLQRAVSVFAIKGLTEFNLQYWGFPAGMGKSYIIALIAYLCLKASLNVTIIIPDSDLLARDQKKFEHLFSLTGKSPNYTTDFPLKAKAKDLLLVDEADQIMHKLPMYFKKTQFKPSVIAFTASCENQETNSVEKLLLETLKFKTIHYWPASL